jgi:hypothetical protein
MKQIYTTKLQAGLGLIEDTRILLNLWEPGMNPPRLLHTTLNSGVFPNMSARRVRNIVIECFAPRYLGNNEYPAWVLKPLSVSLSSAAFHQLLFLFTARANAILADFVKQVYWKRCAGGHVVIHNEEAREFVTRANQEGKTTTSWSESTIRRVAGYLTGCCSDFGLLELGRRSVRKIVPYRNSQELAGFLAYDLHFAGLGDNAVVAHPDWELFGLEKEDVRDELKRLALKGFWIIQTAGESTRISWSFRRWEEVIDVIVGR